MKKHIFPTELAYLAGICILAFGAALMEAADFGVSMVVAPAYLCFRKLSPLFPFVTYGMAEYCLQALLLVLTVLCLRKFRLSFLFSFVIAVFYGMVLDLGMWLLDFIPYNGVPIRVVYYLIGIFFCALGVSLLFHTYIAPEVYELFVKEVSAKFGFDINKTKTVYDCTSCVVSVILSFAFFGFLHFEGVKWGTVLVAPINGFLIGLCSKWMDKRFDWVDKLPLRSFFEGKKA